MLQQHQQQEQQQLQQQQQQQQLMQREGVPSSPSFGPSSVGGRSPSTPTGPNMQPHSLRLAHQHPYGRMSEGGTHMGSLESLLPLVLRQVGAGLPQGGPGMSPPTPPPSASAIESPLAPLATVPEGGPALQHEQLQSLQRSTPPGERRSLSGGESGVSGVSGGMGGGPGPERSSTASSASYYPSGTSPPTSGSLASEAPSGPSVSSLAAAASVAALLESGGASLVGAGGIPGIGAESNELVGRLMAQLQEQGGSKEQLVASLSQLLAQLLVDR